MSTGSGSGYRVEVDSLRAFASQVRGLLSEFESAAGGTRVHGQSGVSRSAFGTFPEAEALHAKYEDMRNSLREVLDALQQAIDEAQHKAELTARNYEEQEQETSHSLRVNSDGWSVGSTATPMTASYRSNSTAGPAVGPKGPTGSSPAGSGDPQPSW
ncbi:hypothetical protein BX265_4423 [Streptomyces sp. TLI_235]|nr:hypothetical protein [Streptomyces sp. TLI_235]PBC79613.1 hypothetical protein BX265_4423 [Streptomyces sp. TLI_235]